MQKVTYVEDEVSVEDRCVSQSYMEVGGSTGEVAHHCIVSSDNGKGITY